MFWNAELQLRSEIHVSYSALFKIHNITLPNKFSFLYGIQFKLLWHKHSFFKLFRLHWNFLYFSLKLLHFVNVSDQCCSNFLKTEPWKSPDKEYFNLPFYEIIIHDINLFIHWFFFQWRGDKNTFSCTG